MSRRQQQADLSVAIGTVFGPIVRVLENLGENSDEDRRRVRGRFLADIDILLKHCTEFTRGDSGYNFKTEELRIRNILHPFAHMKDDLFTAESILNRIQEAQRELYEVLHSIPIRDSKEIFEAESPFAAHCYFRSLVGTVSTSIQWQDRYFDLSVFDRYLRLVPTRVQVTLVTWPKSKCRGRRDEDRYNEFLRISRLFAAERGVQGYRLFTREDFHDRWLRCDDRMYHHGDSIKALGEDKKFTISKLESTPENRKHFDDEAATGFEVFGLNQSTHL